MAFCNQDKKLLLLRYSPPSDKNFLYAFAPDDIGDILEEGCYVTVAYEADEIDNAVYSRRSLMGEEITLIKMDKRKLAESRIVFDGQKRNHISTALIVCFLIACPLECECRYCTCKRVGNSDRSCCERQH